MLLIKQLLFYVKNCGPLFKLEEEQLLKQPVEQRRGGYFHIKWLLLNNLRLCLLVGVRTTYCACACVYLRVRVCVCFFIIMEVKNLILTHFLLLLFFNCRTVASTYIKTYLVVIIQISSPIYLKVFSVVSIIISLLSIENTRFPSFNIFFLSSFANVLLYC